MSLPLLEKETLADLNSLPVETHCDPRRICFGEPALL